MVSGLRVVCCFTLEFQLYCLVLLLRWCLLACLWCDTVVLVLLSVSMMMLVLSFIGCFVCVYCIGLLAGVVALWCLFVC